MSPRSNTNCKRHPNPPEYRASLTYRALFWIAAWVMPVFAAPLHFSEIEKAYRDGELGEVRADLEAFLKERGDAATREELVFSYKYLGVVYAADSAQQPKAESYFHRLLTHSPRIQILDLYPSPRIQEIFQRIQTEFQARTDYAHQFDSFGNPVNPRSNSGNPPSATTPPTKAEPKKRNTGPTQAQTIDSSKPALWMWIGGMAVVGGGIAAYWWLQREPDAKNQQL